MKPACVRVSLMSQPCETVGLTTVAFASALPHICGNFQNVIGLLESLLAVDLDPLLGDFDAAVIVTLGAVFAKEVNAQSFIVS